MARFLAHCVVGVASDAEYTINARRTLHFWHKEIGYKVWLRYLQYFPG